MNISTEAELQASMHSSVSEIRATTLSATVDFDQDGVQHGFLKLPYSHDQSAWGCIMIPISVVKNGTVINYKYDGLGKRKGVKSAVDLLAAS